MEFDCENCGFITEHDYKCPVCFQRPDRKAKPVDLYEIIFKLRDELDAAKQKTKSEHAGPCLARQFGTSILLKDGTKVKLNRGKTAHNAHVWLSVEPAAQVQTMEAVQKAKAQQ